MYIDSFINADDYQYIINTYVNTENFIPIDTTKSMTYNYYVRPVLVSDNNGVDDPLSGASIDRSDNKFISYTTVLSLVDVYFKTDSYQDITGYSRASWYDSIGNIGGMQGFVASIVLVLIG